MRRSLIVAALVLASAAPADARPISLGVGQNAGVAIDAGGTAYVGWQVNTGRPGDAVQLCVLPPRVSRCASTVTIPFPGAGYDGSRVSVLRESATTVDVVVSRVNLGDADTYLARSVDRGRTFALPVRIASDGYEQAAQGIGRVALVGGPGRLLANVVAPDGSGAATPGVALGAPSKSTWTDVTTSNDEVLVAGSDARATQVFRLAGYGSPDATVWRELPAPRGSRPQLAGGMIMFQPEGTRARSLSVRFLTGRWSQAARIAPAADSIDYELTLDAWRRRFSALIAYPGRLEYTTSADGVLWSSLVTVAEFADSAPNALEIATASGGQGIAVVDGPPGDEQVRVVRFNPHAAPLARASVNPYRKRVQVRSHCEGDTMALVAEAASEFRRLPTGRVIRRAAFGRADGVRLRSAGRWSARYDVRRRARIPVRITPRSGSARTLRLPVRPCGATR